MDRPTKAPRFESAANPNQHFHLLVGPSRRLKAHWISPMGTSRVMISPAGTHSRASQSRPSRILPRSFRRSLWFPLPWSSRPWDDLQRNFLRFFPESVVDEFAVPNPHDSIKPKIYGLRPSTGSSFRDTVSPLIASWKSDLGIFPKTRRFQSQINNNWITFFTILRDEFRTFVKSSSTLSLPKRKIYFKNAIQKKRVIIISSIWYMNCLIFF